MELQSVKSRTCGLTVTFADGQSATFPYIWLRDNDPAGFHPDTRERTFDLTTVPLDIQSSGHTFTPTSLSVTWPQVTAPSLFEADWLYRHRPGIRRFDPSDIPQRTWTAASLAQLPRFSAVRCADDPLELARLLTTFKRYGLAIVDELDDDLQAGERFGDLIGFKRETNYGVMFEVRNKPDPINLAYTALPLPLHTDLANQEHVPGVQFLHCIANTADGGDSVFADGFQVCRDMEREAPEQFAALKRIAVPWRFFDDSCDIIHRWPVIMQREDGQFDALTFNAHLADIPDLEADELMEFYAAYQDIMRRIRSDRYRYEYRLAAGEMVIMANRRVLHGRTGFEPGSGVRHLRGYYIEMNELNSRLRVIARDYADWPLER